MRKVKKAKKITKAKLEKQRKALANKCLRLWAETVKILAGRVCIVPDCDIIERLNAHHIESKYNCRGLKFDIHNGLCLCPGHHKFKQDSAHKSFCFVLECLTADDIDYLTIHRNDQVEFSREYLIIKMAELQMIIDKIRKNEANNERTYAYCQGPPPGTS